MLHLPKSKNGDARDVPLSQHAVELLEVMKGIHLGQVFTMNASLRDAYSGKARRLPPSMGPSFHDARATAITRQAKKLELLELARMVGQPPRSAQPHDQLPRGRRRDRQQIGLTINDNGIVEQVPDQYVAQASLPLPPAVGAEDQLHEVVIDAGHAGRVWLFFLKQKAKRDKFSH